MPAGQSVLKVDIRWEKLKAKMEQLPGGLKTMTRTKLRMVGNLLLGEIKRQVRNTSRNKTGELASSWRMDQNIRKVGNNLQLVLGSTSQYARMQEMGGTIHPKTRRYLTVPLRRYRKNEIPPANVLWRQGKTFIHNNVIFEKSQDNSPPRPLYVLRRQVTLQGKWYVRRALRFYGPRIKDTFGEGIKAQIRS